MVSPIALTTTQTSWPALRVATMRSATRLMRSASDTDEPPYFCTTRPMGVESRGGYVPAVGARGDDVERTPDGRWLVVDGRRWRATDPEIPEDVAAALLRELMSARRAVGAALRVADAVAERAARDRVHRAKTALGERGTPWWAQTTEQRRARWEAGLPEPDP